LTDAANLADAALGYYQTNRSLAATDLAVTDAEKALATAHRSGDAVAIQQAEATLDQARQAREGALMGAIGAGDGLMQTAAAVGEKRHELAQVERLRQVGALRGEQLLAVLQDPRASSRHKQEAMAALIRLATAGAVYESAVRSGDPTAIREARSELERLDAALRARPPGAIQVASLGLRDVPPSPQATEAGEREAAPETRSQPADASSAEGWDSFWEGAAYGDFSQNDSWSATGAQIVVGIVPWVGQAADVRDTAAAINQIREGQPGGWMTLLAAVVGWFPGAGDAVKGMIRGGRKAAGEVAEEAAEQALRAGRASTEEASAAAARGTSAGKATGRIEPSRGGRRSVESGRAGEESVSREIGIERNAGPGRVAVPGTGRGGFRIPDFPPEVTIQFRGSVVEVKNVGRLSITPQLRDLATYAEARGVTLEIFTNAPQPLRGQLADLVASGVVTIQPIR
jgi:hypothetical protein